jgi:hypothetical protein
MNTSTSVEKQPLKPGYSRPQPEHLAESTVWPVALALGITLILWGLVSSLMITGFGATLFAGALAGWITEIRHERKGQE